ncbi:hypothetical protein [Sandaracinus amylolyticus]|uniref:hypothetical protein n=1 Tax=Sandaracinus amylolyticus TaxID=927083 RepID=UPI001F2217D8|nr:hypothetical protein [Sandaracinus amylolyticus]UJR86958.1 Hypothetical protein I5071_90590 [Sandaracinus amylolyticus]
MSSRALVLSIALASCGAPAAAPDDYDPLATALASRGHVENPEAPIPPLCYTATDGRSNPCYVCHTVGVGPFGRADWDLQVEYAFSDAALENRWTNLFVDRTERAARWDDDAMLAWIREDDYVALRRALEQREGYAGYVPDLDFDRGFDERGFARDGSGWRALRYKPFPGTFWPTNGSSDDVFVRLSRALRSDARGVLSDEIHAINLAILEAALGSGPDHEVEPIDETIARVDLDGDGVLSSRITTIRGLPSHYVGGGADVPVIRFTHPIGTEYLHSVRYVDPDAPDLRSRRMKELRYMRRVDAPDRGSLLAAMEDEREERDRGRVPSFRGSPDVGFRNAFGWQLQGFIEDARGRLRVQTEEEHRFCMGCHGGLGVTIDSVFSLPRRVPGADGWRLQDLRGMQDAPQSGHDTPEVLEYFQRVGGADELRGNDEMRARFWPGGALDERAVRRASIGGDRDLAWLLTPSRERALDLARAYRVIVEEQSFTRGRDATLRPAQHVHRRIEEPDSGLEAAGLVRTDGRLTLDW